MLFSSIPFLYYFLPAVIAVYFLSPAFLKNGVLLLASLLFYGWGEPKYVFLMCFSILLFYFCGLGMNACNTNRGKKVYLALSVAVSLTILGIFKYADFFIGNINAVTGLSLPFLRLALPVGVSFYTFQCLSYTIDLYRGKAEVQKNLITFGAYVALFPQLIAGPIVRYVDIEREFKERKHSLDQFLHGLSRFLAGLAKKVLIADNLAVLIALFRDSGDPSVLFYWMYALAFFLQIYFDFSGYSCMAIGLGEMFGFHFPENFNYPYLSRSVTEFWRRWHISLGSWFRDYVYIPLGGNRVKPSRWIFNVLTVWMLTGLWHGAGWNFVLWGLLYAFFLILEKKTGFLEKLPDFLKHTYVILVVMLGFVLFNAADFKGAITDFSGLLGLGDLPFVTGETLYYLKSYGVLFLIAILGATPVPKNLWKSFEDGKKTGLFGAVLKPVGMLLLLLVTTAYLVDGSFSPFLYFRF